MKTLLAIFAGCLMLVARVSAQSYVAAVLEYAPQPVPGAGVDVSYVLENVRQYITFIQQARSLRLANIVVFPEYGLTTTILPEDLTNISTVVPDPSLNIAPCNSNTTFYANFLIDLSCAARTHGIFTVVNLLERETNNETEETFFYNTNVVFDITGVVVARYRKINLFNEPQLTPGTEVVTFTAFDVTFGLFTCFDILFRRPAQEVLELGATDIIYPTAWTSETPFHQSFSVQDGYSKAAGVNLLVAGYSNVTNGMAGAAIFSGNATILASALSPAYVQNLIHATVPRLNVRTPEAVCSNNLLLRTDRDEPRIGLLPELTAVFEVMQENMNLYTFQDLELDVNVTQGQICSEDSDFCCDYEIEFNSTLTPNSTIYRMVAFFGRRGFNGAGATTIGLRTCALVHCSSEDTASCGLFNATTNVNFRRIMISTTVPSDANNSFYQPATLNVDHRPLEGYSFCTNEAEGSMGITISIENRQTVFAFGIFGRVFTIDGMPEGRGEATNANVSFVLFLTALACLLLHNY